MSVRPRRETGSVQQARASRRRGAPQRRALCSNSGARAAGVLRAHGVRVIAALCPLAQPLSLSPVHTHGDPAIIRSCPQCQCAGAAARAHEDERVHERACGRRGDGLGALAPERIGARVAAVDRCGGRRRAALAIRRHELGRGAHVGHRATFARVHGGQQRPGARRAAGRGSNSQLCGGASASEARGFRGVGGGVVGAGSPASQSLSLRCLPCSFPLRLRFCARLAHSFFSLVRVGVPPGLCPRSRIPSTCPAVNQ